MNGSTKPVDLHRSILIINQNNDSRKRYNLLSLVDKVLDLFEDSPSIKEEVTEFLKLMTSSNDVTSISIIGTSIYANASGSPKSLELPNEIVAILSGNDCAKKELVLI